MEEITYKTVEQVAKWLQLSPDVIRRLIAEGKIGAAKVGKVWRIDERSVIDYMSQGGDDKDSNE